jgi:hypothetical protein
MKSDQEPLLRFAVTGIEQAINHIDRLPGGECDSALDLFRHHAREAIHELRAWAKVNDIEIRESMKT